MNARATHLERGRATLTFVPVGDLNGFFLGIGEESFAMLHRPPRHTEVSMNGEQMVALVEWD